MDRLADCLIYPRALCCEYPRALSRMGRAMIELYCHFFAKAPKGITLDIDETFDAVHGGQPLSLFNAHYD